MSNSGSQRQQPTRLPHPWDSPGKNTKVGCHFLLQCMKVISEREVAQSCPTLSDSMDCSLPGSSIHGICQARVLEWVAIAFSMLMLVSPFVPLSPSLLCLLLQVHSLHLSLHSFPANRFINTIFSGFHTSWGILDWGFLREGTLEVKVHSLINITVRIAMGDTANLRIKRL